MSPDGRGFPMKLNHVTLEVTILDRSLEFYERLGLETIVYAAPRYARLALPGHDSSLSVEVMPGSERIRRPAAQIYLECEHLDELHEALEGAGVLFDQPPTDMPYLWREARLRDPDGHDIRLYRAGSNRLFPPWRLSSLERQALIDKQLKNAPQLKPEVRVETWSGQRRDLLDLFRLAEDSQDEIERYIDEGDVLVASQGSPIGLVHLIERGEAGDFEIKNLAVAEGHQRLGIGTRLVEAAVDLCRARCAPRLRVSAAASSLGALGFYLATGFRVSGVVRDAFSEAKGYAPGLIVEGLPLNDALLLDLELGDTGLPRK